MFVFEPLKSDVTERQSAHWSQFTKRNQPAKKKKKKKNQTSSSGYIVSALVNDTTMYVHNFGSFFLLVDDWRATNYTFTTLGAKGEIGPISTSGYLGTPLEGRLNLSNGIQIWTVPVTGSYVIEATGGSGANGSFDHPHMGPLPWRLGGLGARIRGTFHLVQGTQLKILVGQEGGASQRKSHEMPGGGGGGSFITLLNNTPLVIAGGGGGGGAPRKHSKFGDGDPGQATEDGSQCGGTGGTGGRVCNTDTGMVSPLLIAGGGAGISGDGGGQGHPVTLPSSFINGGIGGTCPVASGGFGGGSFAFELGGGGGGYSGGGVTSSRKGSTAGGGGSYNGGTNQQNSAGVNKGDGKVIIKL